MLCHFLTIECYLIQHTHIAWLFCSDSVYDHAHNGGNGNEGDGGQALFPKFLPCRRKGGQHSGEDHSPDIQSGAGKAVFQCQPLHTLPKTKTSLGANEVI